MIVKMIQNLENKMESQITSLETRVGHHLLCLSETQRQAGECHSLTVEKGSLQVCPRWLEDVAMGKLEMASL